MVLSKVTEGIKATLSKWASEPEENTWPAGLRQPEFCVGAGAVCPGEGSDAQLLGASMNCLH